MEPISNIVRPHLKVKNEHTRSVENTTTTKAMARAASYFPMVMNSVYPKALKLGAISKTKRTTAIGIAALKKAIIGQTVTPRIQMSLFAILETNGKEP